MILRGLNGDYLLVAGGGGGAVGDEWRPDSAGETLRVVAATWPERAMDLRTFVFRAGDFGSGACAG